MGPESGIFIETFVSGEIPFVFLFFFLMDYGFSKSISTSEICLPLFYLFRVLLLCQKLFTYFGLPNSSPRTSLFLHRRTYFVWVTRRYPRHHSYPYFTYSNFTSTYTRIIIFNILPEGTLYCIGSTELDNWISSTTGNYYTIVLLMDDEYRKLAKEDFVGASAVR